MKIKWPWQKQLDAMYHYFASRFDSAVVHRQENHNEVQARLSVLFEKQAAMHEAIAQLTTAQWETKNLVERLTALLDERTTEGEGRVRRIVEMQGRIQEQSISATQRSVKLEELKRYQRLCSKVDEIHARQGVLNCTTNGKAKKARKRK